LTLDRFISERDVTHADFKWKKAIALHIQPANDLLESRQDDLMEFTGNGCLEFIAKLASGQLISGRILEHLL
jgi:hypothetical protein